MSPAAPISAPGGMGHSLRIGAFRNVFASATVSALGGAVSAISVTWVVYHYTHSALDIAFLGMTGILPGIALGLLAGVLADRYNRRTLMVTADLVRMVGMAVLASTLFLVGFSLPLVLAVMLLVYSFSALFAPASQAILPRLVPTGSLEDANGLLQATSSLMNSVGSAAGGLVVVLAGAVWGLGINALTYAVSASFLIRVATDWGRPRASGSRAAPSLRTELSEGLRYIVDHRAILEVTLGFLPANLLASLVAPFFVVYAAQEFGSDPAVYGYLVGTLALGSALGALSVSRLRARRFAGLLMGLCLLGQSGTVGALALAHLLPVALLAAFAFGVVIGLINTTYYATMQAIVPGEILARVLSIDSVGSFAAIPAGLVIGGILIAQRGVTFCYLVASIGLVANGVAALAMPGFRSLRYRA